MRYKIHNIFMNYNGAEYSSSQEIECDKVRVDGDFIIFIKLDIPILILGAKRFLSAQCLDSLPDVTVVS